MRGPAPYVTHRRCKQRLGTQQLELNESSAENGVAKTRLILNRSELLGKHLTSYLNTKTRSYISENPEIDIYFHACDVYMRLSKLMSSIVENIILDDEFVHCCMQRIELFLSLESPTDTLLLVDAEYDSDANPPEINLKHTQISLGHLCGLLSTYLKRCPFLLFSYQGKGVKAQFGQLLPGFYNLLNTQHPIHEIDFHGAKFQMLKEIASPENSPTEIISLYYSAKERQPDKDCIDFSWRLYRMLIEGLKVLGDSQSSH